MKRGTVRREPEFKKAISNIYSRTMITKHVALEIKNVGSNIKEILESSIKEQYEGRCIAEGFIKHNSIKVITYSSGMLKGARIIFEVVFECMVCFPVEGQLINCVAKNITKAGIRGESLDENPTPFIVFIPRDYEVSNPLFSEIKETDGFVARIIAQRFELNDTYVSIYAELVDKKKYR